MTTLPARSVLVVGAGIGGLTTALLLAGAGASVTVLERAARPAEVGAGLMVQPNGLAVLDGLGLTDRVVGLGRRLSRLDLRNAAGQLIASQPVPDFGEGLDYCAAVLRHDLHRVLLAAVAAQPKVELRTGITVRTATPDGTVSADGPGGQVTQRADLVVGADGVGSVVRQGGRFGSRVSNRRTDYVRALVPTVGPEVFVEYWTPLGAFGAAAVADGVTYGYAAAYRGAAAQALARRDLPAFRAAWRAVLPEAGDVLDRVPAFDDLIVSGVRRVRCRRWRDGRLVLLGDAAHAMAPNAGQGANSAMVDAVALAGALVGGSDLDQALEAYQHRRRTTVHRVQRAADTLARLSGLQTRATSRARDLAIGAAARGPRRIARSMRGAQQADPVALREAVRDLVTRPSGLS